jgi:acyl carrier protein
MKKIAKAELVDAIAAQLGVSRELVQPDALFAEDLRADSLDMVELGMMLETTFDVEIEQRDSMKLKSVADAMRFVEQKLGYSPWLDAAAAEGV